MLKMTGWCWEVLRWGLAMVWSVGMGLTITPPDALATTNICRTIDQHQVCIMTIKRSAKNFWEYNAAVSIDGKRGPKEPYNCRSHFKTNAQGRSEYFGKESIGSLVCRAYRAPTGGMPLELSPDL